MDFERFVNSKVYAIFDKFYVLVILNIIWFITVILGVFGIFTFFPATVAFFVLINTLIHEKDFPIFKSFYTIFVKEYWKAQKLFLIFFIFGYILYLDIRLYYNAILDKANFFNNMGFWFSLVFALLYFMILIHVFMVSIYFPDYKTFKKIKFAFLFSAAYPFRTFFLIMILGGSIFLIMSVPYLLPVVFLILVSVIIYLTIKILKPKYDKVSQDKKGLVAMDYLQ